MQACPGPTPGAILYARLRRPAAALTVLSVLAATLTTAPSVDQPAAASSTCTSTCAPAALPRFDETAEARDLMAAERAGRSRRDTAAQGLGPATQAVKTVKVQPKQPRKPASTKPPKRRQATTASPVQASGSLAAVVRFALAQVGDRYVWGASGPDSWDCSGLIMKAFAQIGIRLPHQSGGIAARGRTVPQSQLRAGDVLAWPGHVALALGRDNLMVHASRPGVPVKVATIYGNPRVVRIVG